MIIGLTDAECDFLDNFNGEDDSDYTIEDIEKYLASRFRLDSLDHVVVTT